MHSLKSHLTWFALPILAAWALALPAPLEAQTSPAVITLAQTPSPAVAQPGVTVLTLVASGMPAGVITPANLNVTLQVASPTTGPALTAQVIAYAAIPGGGGRITFQVQGPNVSTPTPYSISASGSTSTGVAFASGKAASMTINPAAAIASISPATAAPGQSLSVTITGQYTNYVQGSTVASFGPGISVGGATEGHLGPVTVTSSTAATANLVIDPAATAGPRAISVATGVQQASLAPTDGFQVLSARGNQPPIVSAGPNQLTSITNENLLISLPSSNKIVEYTTSGQYLRDVVPSASPTK